LAIGVLGWLKRLTKENKLLKLATDKIKNGKNVFQNLSLRIFKEI
jgi:hypothetical protein